MSSKRLRRAFLLLIMIKKHIVAEKVEIRKRLKLNNKSKPIILFHIKLGTILHHKL